MNPKDKITQISKMLSFVLRHKPESIGIALEPNGWVDVNELIQKLQSKIEFTIDDLKEVVATCEKQRFKFSDDGKKIKANQGHSADVELEFEKIVPPFKLYHGTAPRFVPSILKEGLKKMNRHHVHLYTEENLKKAVDTGSRHEKGVKPAVLVIEAKQMHNEGFKFFKSDNDVYLTESVPPKYIKIYDADFKLEFCKKCIQMTNHLNGICQKCKGI